MTESAPATILKYQRLGGLNNIHFFLTVLQAGKSKIKVPKDLVLVEDLLPGSQMATISLYAHITSLCAPGESELCSSPSSCRH